MCTVHGECAMCIVQCALYTPGSVQCASVHCTRGVCSVQGSCLMRQEQITSHCPQSQLEGDDAQDDEDDEDEDEDDDHQ